MPRKYKFHSDFPTSSLRLLLLRSGRYSGRWNAKKRRSIMHTSTKEDIARRFRRFAPPRIISKDLNRLFSVILSSLLPIIKILLKFRQNNLEMLHRFLVVVQFKKVEFTLDIQIKY